MVGHASFPPTGHRRSATSSPTHPGSDTASRTTIWFSGSATGWPTTTSRRWRGPSVTGRCGSNQARTGCTRTAWTSPPGWWRSCPACRTTSTCARRSSSRSAWSTPGSGCRQTRSTGSLPATGATPARSWCCTDDPATSTYLRTPKLFNGGGGLVGTTADYLRFCTMLAGGGALDGRRVLSRKTLELMTTNHLPDDGDMADFALPMGYGEVGLRRQRLRPHRRRVQGPTVLRHGRLGRLVHVGRRRVDDVLGRPVGGARRRVHDPAAAVGHVQLRRPAPLAGVRRTPLTGLAPLSETMPPADGVGIVVAVVLRGASHDDERGRS